MKHIWKFCGCLAYWCTLPVFSLYVRRTQRTRVLVLCGNKLLVAKPWLGDGKWSLPGGGLHRGEDVAVGAIRELYEETGIMVGQHELKPIGRYSFSNHGIRFPYELFTISVASCLPVRRQRFEIAEVQWLSASRVSARNAGPDVLTAIRRAS